MTLSGSALSLPAMSWRARGRADFNAWIVSAN
jgi:hypothetical protein